MGGFFGVASKKECCLELFYGVDYHSHLGTRRAGMATYGEDGFNRAIHSIVNTPFRTKFEDDLAEMNGYMGIGCISDTDPQPLLIQSHLGSFAITILGKINNYNDLLKELYDSGRSHFQEMTSGKVNGCELVAALICTKPSILEGIQYAQEIVDGSLTVLLMTPEGIYAARDRYGRTPVILGQKEDAYCVSFESHAYVNLGYSDYKELGPGEIVLITSDEVKVLKKPGDKMKICSFLWVYYGYPTSGYEGINVENMRYKCGHMLAKRDDDDVKPDIVAGVPDSGTAHAIGYSNESGIPFARPFIKYTPTWPRSFMPKDQSQRDLIAKMKLIPVQKLIKDKKLLLIDDSIVRGTQLRETAEFLYQSGAKEVHVRPACPPLIHGCKYLNFSRSKSEMDLITRRVISDLEGTKDIPAEVLDEYSDPDSVRYQNMVDEMCKRMGFTSLRFHRLDDLIESIGLERCQLCTYCFDGKE